MLRLAGIGVAVAAVTLSAAPLRAQLVPDVQTIRARIAAAAGVRPQTERIVWKLTADELGGTEIVMRSGADYRVDRTLGPFHSAHGMTGDAAWTQDENGQTALALYDSERGAVELADDVGTPSVASASSPAGGYVISQLDAAGFGTLEYVDPAWRIVREDRITASRTVTTLFDDFRKSHGYVHAWHRTVVDGGGHVISESRIVSDDAVPVAAAALTIPGARALVEFPAGATSVALPVHYDRERRRFVVRVDIGSRGLDFLLDTGASRLSIDRDVVNALGLRSYGAFVNGVNAGQYVTSRSVVPELRIGELVMHDVELETMPHVAGGDGAERVVGLIGFDFFNGIGVRFDYQAGTVTAVERSAIVAPSAPATLSLDVRLGSHQPETKLAVNGALGNRFALDTGGAGALLITDHFAIAHPEALASADPARGDVSLEGLGGRFVARATRVHEMLLGDRTFGDFDAYRIVTGGAYAGNQDGLIGPDFLENFVMFTDYPDRKIYLTPDVKKIAIGPAPEATPNVAAEPSPDDFGIGAPWTPFPMPTM